MHPSEPEEFPKCTQRRAVEHRAEALKGEAGEGEEGGSYSHTLFIKTTIHKIIIGEDNNDCIQRCGARTCTRAKKHCEDLRAL